MLIVNTIVDDVFPVPLITDLLYLQLLLKWESFPVIYVMDDHEVRKMM